MIFKRMREQILDKAIRGQLVPQLQEEDVVEQIGDAPSEVPFEIPSSWKWVQLVNTCVYIQRGKSPKYSEIQEIPVIAQKCNQWDGVHLDKAKFIDPQTADKYTQERWLQDNDLMWNSTGLGTIGRIAIYKECLNPYKKAVVDSHVTVIRTDPKILEPRYLYYYISSKTVQGVIENRSDGTTKQKELATSTVQAYEIPLPPINEQRRIADKIDSLFSEINRAEKAYEELQSLANVLRGQILQKAIQGKLVPQLPEDGIVEQIGNAPEEVPFEIPKSWKWVNLVNTCIYVQRGKSPKYSEIQEIPVIAQKCNQWDGMQIEKAKFIDPQTADSYTEERWLKDNDLMWNSTGVGTLGRVAIYKDCLNPYKKAVADSHVTVIRTDSNFLDPLYLYYYIRSNTVQDVIEYRSGGSTKQKELSTTTIKLYELPLPPLAEQKRIVAKVEALFQQIDLMTK